MKIVWQAFSPYTWCMELYYKDFCYMELYDKHFWCMEVNPGLYEDVFSPGQQHHCAHPVPIIWPGELGRLHVRLGGHQRRHVWILPPCRQVLRARPSPCVSALFEQFCYLGLPEQNAPRLERAHEQNEPFDRSSEADFCPHWVFASSANFRNHAYQDPKKTSEK